MDEAYRPDAVADDAGSCSATISLEVIPGPIVLQHHQLDLLFMTPPDVPACTGIPITMEDGKPVVWIVHVFSGRRRRGDCHWWAEHISSFLWPGVIVRMLSFDTVVHSSLGSLSKGDTLDRLLRY